MSRLHSHINSAANIIEVYKGDVPLSAFLKNFFAKEKKYGSKDRRSISSLCFNYYRLGNSLKDLSHHEKLLTSLFIFSSEPNDLFEQEKPGWNEKVQLPLSEKCKVVNLDIEAIFPFVDELSEGIAVGQFNRSFLIQPDVFIRIRLGFEKKVRMKLEQAQVAFQSISEDTISIASGTKLEDILEINKEAVIQDLNSQRVGELLPIDQLPANATVWDCCAASGGKAIMAVDLLPGIQLTATDIRQSIIHNLQKRFLEADVKKYQSKVADVTNKVNVANALGHQKFDLIICDAPCSGSGTWARTPEQLLFFKKEEITRYSNLQKQISANTIPYLAKEGYLLYITCSVFQKENEEVVSEISKNSSLKLIEQRIFKGYNEKADSMFAALFQRVIQ